MLDTPEMTEDLRRAVMDDESPQKLGEIADADGRVSIQTAGWEKVKAGLTSPEELIEKVLLDT